MPELGRVVIAADGYPNERLGELKKQEGSSGRSKWEGETEQGERGNENSMVRMQRKGGRSSSSEKEDKALKGREQVKQNRKKQEENLGETRERQGRKKP